MGGGSGFDDPAVVAAFHRALLHGGLVVALLLVALGVVWTFCRSALARGGGTSATAGARSPQAGPATDSGSIEAAGASWAEPPGRRLIRIGFGLLWIFDGVLQAQASMPLGMIPRVLSPAAATSPAWVRQVTGSVTSIWTYHPVTAAASTVWIQAGIGLFLLVAARGTWSRLAGVASAAWGLLVWIFGEAFGGVFAPGLTWLFGAPGAALLYVLAGVLVALPASAWSTARLGRWALRATGWFFAAMALLQAWPGRGFWQGASTGGGSGGSLAAMTHAMAQTPQPGPLKATVRAFASFDATHGWGVNLFAVVALAAVGLALQRSELRVVRAAVAVAAVLCVADWVLVEDLGFLGGTGTDPNSMIPMALILFGGYLAWIRQPAVAPATPEAPVPEGWRHALFAEPAYTLRVSAAVAAVGVTLVGAVPLAVAAAHPGTRPVAVSASPAPQP